MVGRHDRRVASPLFGNLDIISYKKSIKSILWIIKTLDLLKNQLNQAHISLIFPCFALEINDFIIPENYVFLNNGIKPMLYISKFPNLVLPNLSTSLSSVKDLGELSETKHSY